MGNSFQKNSDYEIFDIKNVNRNYRKLKMSVQDNYLQYNEKIKKNDKNDLLVDPFWIGYTGIYYVPDNSGNMFCIQHLCYRIDHGPYDYAIIDQVRNKDGKKIENKFGDKIDESVVATLQPVPKQVFNEFAKNGDLIMYH